MIRLKYLTFSLVLLATFAFTHCGGRNLDVSKISSTENPTEQITSLETGIQKARNEKVNVLSPNWYSKAETSLKSAKRMQKEGGSLENMFESVAQGRAELERANEMARLARTALPKAIKAREDARAAGATMLGRDYEKTETAFQKLTEEIEDNNLDWARTNQDRVAKSFRNLELRAIKEQALGQAREIIQKAEYREAKRWVPQTLATAKKKLSDADAFISQNRYNKEELLSKANEALFFANRLSQMLDQSMALKEKSPEQTSLWMEGMLASISKTLSAPDMRNQNFKTQVENINGTISSLHQDQAFLAEKTKTQDANIAELNQKVAKLEGLTKTEQEEMARLEAEKRFNKLYGEVRSTFESNEAEVYKQGDHLLIRLKAMQFPVGKAIIMPNNYALLSKVQHAIRTFGEPKVTIEGHTDTTGSEALNEHLSQERAEAVKKYFVANQTLVESKLVSLGYGPSKPIAPNTTTEGRAMNRRIDVVISPEMTINK